MTDMELYAVPIPRGSTTSTGSIASQQQALQSILGSDTGNVENIASEPGERTLTVEYPDKLAAVRAQELRELASGFGQPLPFHALAGSSPDDRYVTVSRADIGPVDPRSREFQRGDVTLSDVGTIASHWREVRTSPSEPDNPFGNDTTAPVGIPSAATKVRWLDPETRQTAEPAVIATRSSRLGNVDIIDATGGPYDSPSVIFELPYAREGDTDPRVWDTRGKATITDSDGAVLWQKVFSPSHRFEGDLVLENGLLRLTIDESAGTISAERWDSGSSSWTSESLGASDWTVFDVDIRSIGLAQVGGVVEFADTTQFPTAYHTLGFQLARGNNNILWTTESTVPSGLETLLDPTAASHTYDPYGAIQATPQQLRAREEVA